MKIKTVVISVGGEGTRMRDLLGDIPKVLAQINGIPFLHLVLDKWKELGAEHVHLLLGYKSAEIWTTCQKWLNSNEENGDKIKISASIEPFPLGVGGALMLAAPFLKEPFILTYGDVYPTVDMNALCASVDEDCEGCMAICRREIAKEQGNINIEDEFIICYDKSNTKLDYVDVGAIALKPKVLHSEGFSTMSEGELLTEVVKRRKLKGFLHNAPSKHIGDPQAYKDFLLWFQRTGGQDGKKKI